MLKILQKKSIMIFAGIVVVGGIVTTTLPMFNSTQTIQKTRTSNINKNDETNKAINPQNIQKNDTNKDTTSLSETEKSNDNSQNNNDKTNQQNTKNYNLEKSNNTNNKAVTSSPQNNTTKQTTTNTKVTKPTLYYDRTTTIYANDNITLLRVEYYKNNKLTYYSVVEQFDANTKSYVEKIYKCNHETNIDTLIRTDVYVNGNLTE